MKPDLDRVLEVCAIGLMADVAPHVAPAYRQATVFSTGVILTTVREELDRIASRRVEEIDALRALFTDALPAVEDAALRERLEAAVHAAPPGLRISQLEQALDGLRALLIALHAHVEAQDGQAARAVEAAIWRELAASTGRRRLSLGAF